MLQEFILNYDLPIISEENTKRYESCGIEAYPSRIPLSTVIYKVEIDLFRFYSHLCIFQEPIFLLSCLYFHGRSSVFFWSIIKA